MQTKLAAFSKKAASLVPFTSFRNLEMPNLIIHLMELLTSI
jgi:hypothetical protein